MDCPRSAWNLTLTKAKIISLQAEREALLKSVDFVPLKPGISYEACSRYKQGLVRYYYFENLKAFGEASYSELRSKCSAFLRTLIEIAFTLEVNITETGEFIRTDAQRAHWRHRIATTVELVNDKFE